MSFEAILLFIPACFALNMIFGPNNLLSLTIGAREGLRTALLAAAGRLVAFSIMIAIAALGMGALLTASETAFLIVKLIGAAYLVWLGIKILRAKSAPLVAATQQPQRTCKTLARQEFLVAIGNPKAILIFTAFFPQFVQPQSYWLSFLTLGAIFLTLEIVAIALYAYAGSRLANAMHNASGVRWINRISGTTMIGFGLMLVAAKQ